jgi:hypothetical protein
MAVMTTGQRRDCWAEMMEGWSRARQGIPVEKDDLLLAVNAIDQWISDQSTSFNNALPAVVRNALTTSAKVELFIFVLRRRFLNGT